MKTLKIAFMGTPDFACPALQALIDSPHDVVCVYSQPPRPAGRGQRIHKSAVHQLAEAHNIPVLTPKSLKKPPAQETFSAHDLDLAVVAAYGLILPQAILDAPKYGCINIHGSTLPRWRGAAPIQRAILAGDTETGICIMQMDAGLDTGDVLLDRRTPITQETTAQSLHDTLATMGAEMTVEVINALAKGTPFSPTPQREEGMTYAKMLSREDGRIDWQKSAIEIERQIRALTPWPGVWCEIKGKRLKIHAAEIIDRIGKAGEILEKDMIVGCGKGALRLTSVQPENRARMSGTDFINGGRAKIGDSLS